jgi:hypothetical protein
MANPPFFPFVPTWDDEMQRQYEQWGSSPAPELAAGVPQQAPEAPPIAPPPAGTVEQIGKDVATPGAALPTIGRDLPTFTPQELGDLGQAPPLTPEENAQIEMHAPPGAGTIEMPEEFAGHELGPQDPYGDVGAAMAREYGAPDAISGGMPGEQAAVAGQVDASGGAPAPGQTTGSPQMPDEYLSDAELGQQYAGLPVEEQIQKRAEYEQGKQNFAAAEYLKKSHEAQEQAALDLRTYQQSQQIAAARSKEIENEAERLAMKRNPLDDIGIGQKVAAAGAAIIGGFLGNTGGVETIDKLINQAVAQQQQQLQLGQQNLATKRTALNEQMARGDDMYKTLQTYRIASWNRVIGDLQTQVQQYDPRGKVALDVMDQIHAAREKRAQAIAAGTEEDRKRIEADRKLDQEQQKINETHRHNLATEKPKGAGGPSPATTAHENPLIAGLSPKDRERAVLSPDSKDFRLALDHESAVAQRGEIASGKAAIGAMDSLIADLSNNPSIMTKLKAKVGLNPEELAVIKSKLSLAKPQIAKVAAGTGRIPLAELHAVDAATDDPSNFTSETLAQIIAMRDATVNDLVDKFGPEYPNFLTKDSFGHAPKIADAPNINTISGPLLSAPVKGDRGYARLSLSEVDGQLKQAFDQFVTNAGLGGQTEFQHDLDRKKEAQQKAAAAISSEIATLSAKKKLTSEETERLHNDTQALRDRTEAIRAIDDWRTKSVEEAQTAATEAAQHASEKAFTDRSPAAKRF